MKNKKRGRKVKNLKNKNREKDSFLMSSYIDSWKYVLKCKSYLFVAALLFFAFVIFGFVQPVYYVDEITKMLKELLLTASGMNFASLTAYIFLNNLKVSFLVFVLGIFLGLFPIVIISANGYLLGFVVEMVYRESGLKELLYVLPYGIFEIPAVLLSVGMGIRLGMFVFSKRIGKALKERIVKGLIVFILVIIPLLILAAIIESALIIYQS